MKNKDFIQILETLAPRELACEWDNTGLQVGSPDSDFTGAYVALDATPKTVRAAIDAGCSLLVTHHPLLFSPVSAITDQTVSGAMILSMIKAGLSCYSMHTSYDKALGGMADAAAARLGLQHCQPLEEALEDGSGLGRMGTFCDIATGLPISITVRRLAERVKQAFGLDQVTLYAKDENAPITRIALLPGSGKEEWPLALQAGAQAYITGDMNYHGALDALNAGLTVIDAGHDGVEWIFVPEVADYLSKNVHRPDLIYAQKWVSIANHI